MSPRRQRTRPEHPFPFPKNHGGENLKKYAKGFLVGARPPYGGQAARLRVTLLAENRFELGRIAVPKQYNSEISGVFRPIFLWLRAANAKDFSEGEGFLGQP